MGRQAKLKAARRDAAGYLGSHKEWKSPDEIAAEVVTRYLQTKEAEK